MVVSCPSTGTRLTVPAFEIATLELDVPKSTPQEIMSKIKKAAIVRDNCELGKSMWRYTNCPLTVLLYFVVRYSI